MAKTEKASFFNDKNFNLKELRKMKKEHFFKAYEGTLNVELAWLELHPKKKNN